jgi:small-conductance mechanosensitive channel
MLVGDVISTVAAVAVYAIAVVVSRYLLRRRYREEATKILYVVFTLLTAILLGYIAYLWRLFEFVVGFLATAGALGLLLALSLVPWVTDVFAGISIALDPPVKHRQRGGGRRQTRKDYRDIPYTYDNLWRRMPDNCSQ